VFELEPHAARKRAASACTATFTPPNIPRRPEGRVRALLRRQPDFSGSEHEHVLARFSVLLSQIS
jgi:hypothetical protein